MMKREEYIKTRLLDLSCYWYDIILILAAVLFLLFGILDYFVSPEKFSMFFVLRLSVAGLLLCLFLLNKLFRKLGKSKFFLYASSSLATIASAIAIEIMILALGGHKSFYYAGLNLIVICVLGFFLINLAFSAILGMSVYLVYIIPILFSGPITDRATFIANNFFFLSTMLLAIVWRSLSQKTLIKNLGLQYDLDREREHLALYSNQLENLVEERTRELNKSELMYRSLFEHANDGIMIMDTGGTILNVNNKICELHGFDRDSFIGANLTVFETEEDKALFHERMQQILDGESLLYETRHYKKNGEKITLEVSSRALEVDGNILVQAFHRDITEKKRLQSQLLHSQKMDSVGQLAGGIAHDFNNILASILGFAEIILLDEEVEEGVGRRIKQIEGAARKAAQLVSKLLSFARRADFDTYPFNINMVITDTVDMISRLIPRNIRIRKALMEPIPAVKGDPNQIEQVIMNLILNARDAMPEGGELLILTAPFELEKGAPLPLPEMAPGSYIRLSVSDTGVGISEKHLSRIFEPFFTTKAKAKGTGLGLAMVYGIVKAHKGYITVNSRPGKGTTFEIYLPVSDVSSPVRITPVVESEIGGHATILAIDDEMDILQIIEEILSRKGFQVLATEDPLRALAMYREKHASIDLVITDILMPAMNGAQLVDGIRTINPLVKGIGITGFSAGDQVRCDAVLKKPFTGSKLLSTIHEVLGAGRN